ncbi:DUF859 family phage minor structural protein [Enterococcus italicus]|uniref:DUF859 family phage minor structural protein n=1 Tax=Enterococcus italicus TaxID=246144 RepID=UPI002073E279|nr:DUF859 family phage minor structural protein [Enterococcus italicus]
MALSGDFRIGSGVSWLWLYVKWTATPNKGGNYSDVKADVYIQRSGGSSAYNLTNNNLFINIDGNGDTFSVGFDLRNQTSQFLASRTIRVNHNGDGSKTFGISVSYPTGIGGIGTPSGSKSFTLDDIPRAYGFNYSSDTVQYDSPVTLLVFGNGSGNKANVYFNIGGKEVLAYSNAPFDTNFAVIPKLSDFASITPNAAAALGYIIVKTFDPSGQFIGGEQKLFTFMIPSSIVPSISNVDQTELVSKIKNVTGSSTLYIANLSQIQLTTNASGVYGSTIKEYNVSVAGLSFTSTSNTQVIDLSQYNVGTGLITATITVTDSRGRTAASNVTLNVQAYSPPMLKNFKVTRNMDLNTTINIVKTVAVSSIKNGATEKNSYTVVTKYKKTVDTAWITAKTETNTSANFALTGMAIESSYDVQVTITDQLSVPVPVKSSVPSIFMIMSWSATTVGIGKAAEQGVLDIAGKLSDIYVGGISLLDLQRPINSVYQSFDPTDPSILFGGTWNRIAKGQTLIGVNESDTDFATAGKTGGEKTRALVIGSPGSSEIGGYMSGREATGWGLTSSSPGFGNRALIVNGDYTNNVTSAPHNNLQPYITLYIWRRIA